MSTSNVSLLPSQEPRTLEEKILQVQQRNQLVAEMRSQASHSGKAGLATDADALERQYHVRDLAGLADDVYESAAHRPPLQPGWMRASEHPHLLRQAGVNWTDQQIKQYLQPDDSNFRAEIYLPDPRVFGSRGKPVVCYKGSNGAVVANDITGKSITRESAAEDWVNNGLQGAGQESDYYNRAMRLAVDLKRSRLIGGFEIAGHSLGGGMASAASAITGVPGTTFNSSGLNPNTPKRFAEKNGLAVFDADTTVTAYQVKGEVLTDGQVMVSRMDALQRLQMGTVAKLAADLSQLREARTLLSSQLQQAFPHSQKAQQDALGLIDYLAAHSGSQTLKQVPTAAGQVQPVLDAKMRDAQGQLVDRPAQMPIDQLARTAGPLLDVLGGALVGASVGKRTGEFVAGGGQAAKVALDALGDGYRAGGNVTGQVAESAAQTVGRIAGMQVRRSGELVADVRLATGYLGAAVPMVQCVQQRWTNEVSTALLRGASHLPFADRIAPGLGREADRRDQVIEAYCQEKAAQAGGALANARRDAGGIRQAADEAMQTVERRAGNVGTAMRSSFEQAGARVNLGLDEAGRQVRDLGSRAPAGLAVLGGGTGGLISATATFAGPPGLVNGWRTGQLIRHATAASGEATERHLMTETVIPSLDAGTQQLESAAVRDLAQPPRAHQAIPADQSVPADTSRREGALLNDANHSAYPLFRGAIHGVHALDARHNRTPDLRSEQLGGHLAAVAGEQGLRRIDHVMMSEDTRRTFAIEGRPQDPAHKRIGVDTVEGLNTSLAASTQRVEDAQRQLAQSRAPAPTQLQETDTLARPALRLA